MLRSHGSRPSPASSSPPAAWTRWSATSPSQAADNGSPMLRATRVRGDGTLRESSAPRHRDGETAARSSSSPWARHRAAPARQARFDAQHEASCRAARRLHPGDLCVCLRLQWARPQAHRTLRRSRRHRRCRGRPDLVIHELRAFIREGGPANDSMNSRPGAALDSLHPTRNVLGTSCGCGDGAGAESRSTCCASCARRRPTSPASLCAPCAHHARAPRRPGTLSVDDAATAPASPARDRARDGAQQGAGLRRARRPGERGVDPGAGSGSCALP